MAANRLSPLAIQSRKLQSGGAGEPIVMLTAYSYPVARTLDPHVDALLVGDSIGMVLYGLPDTLGVDLEMMIRHGQAVVRGAETACVIVDLPFGSYQQSKEQAFESAARVMAETGCDAVKLEGGAVMAETIRFLVDRGVPVMGHIGLTPQSVHTLGGFKAQGKDDVAQQQLLADAKAVADAGTFSLVLEGVYRSIVPAIVDAVDIPVIGIGAGPECDGQVLVTEDMAGFDVGFVPKFVKSYGSLRNELEMAAKAYASEVRSRIFPTDTQCYMSQKIRVKSDKESV